MTTPSNSSKDTASEEIITSILLSSDPETNSFECFSFPLQRQEPSVVRKTFLRLSCKVHPDKTSHPQATEAFQKLSLAFETLYDADAQAKHLETILLEKQQESQRRRTAVDVCASLSAAGPCCHCLHSILVKYVYCKAKWALLPMVTAQDETPRRGIHR